MEAKTRTRMSAEERKTAIIKSCLPLFVEKGFKSTTTKELAAAAQVSEALLYKHFPSKKKIYKAIQDYCCSNMDNHKQWLESLPNSTESLVTCVEMFMDVAFKASAAKSSDKDFSRLMFNSLLDDGEFARIFHESGCNPWRAKVKLCLEAAIAKGDVTLEEEPANLSSWFVQHLHVGAIILNMPSQKVVNYEADFGKMAKVAVRFCLRGLGLKEELIP
ncbi:MAG: TetR/AcrR family transcriptional regulator [Lentisphaerales bacterium]|nr:TetR/AcrR family transcriptional regulator [Lentisphaerales bacterium]